MITKQLTNLLVDEVTKQLGDRQYFSSGDLYKLGLFSSKQSARAAMKNGKMVFITMSPRRRIVHRTILLDYIKNNITGQ